MFQPIRCRQLIHCHSKVHWSYIWNCIFFQTINIIQFGCPNVLDWLGLPLPLSCFVSIFLKNLLLIWSNYKWIFENYFVWDTLYICRAWYFDAGGELCSKNCNISAVQVGFPDGDDHYDHGDYIADNDNDNDLYIMMQCLCEKWSLSPSKLSAGSAKQDAR